MNSVSQPPDPAERLDKSDQPISEEADYVLEWTVRLYEAEPFKRWAVLGAAVLAGTGGYLLMRHPLFAVMGLLAVLATTAEFWAPLKYTLNANRASVRCVFSVTAIYWTDVKRAICSPKAIKLSPQAETSRTSPFRGVVLRLAGNSDAVREFIERHKPEDARFVEYGTDGGTGAGPAGVGSDRD